MSWSNYAIHFWADDCRSQQENVDPLATHERPLKRRRRTAEPAKPPCKYKRGREARMSPGGPARNRRAGNGNSDGGVVGGRATPERGGKTFQKTFEGNNDETTQQYFDLDATPRPCKRFGEVLADLSPKRSNSASEASSDTSRSLSPSKRNFLRSLQRPIKTLMIEQGTWNSSDTDLLHRIRRAAAGFETVPASMQLDLQAAYPDDFDLHQTVIYRSEDRRTRLGADPSLRELASIVTQACGCRQRCDIEAGWNSHVHGPILLLAQALSVYGRAIGTANVTTARINPKYLPDTANGLFPLQGKVIDFVAFLTESASTEAAFDRLESETGTHGRDFNHTLHTPISALPIALSIETKTEGEGYAKANVQLDVWVDGHLQRLEELASHLSTDTDSQSAAIAPIPTLPLLLVQGPVWHLLLARRENSTLESSEGGTTHTRVYEKLTFGDATKVSGLLKILTVLLELFSWAETTYRPWFEKHVCGVVP